MSGPRVVVWLAPGLVPDGGIGRNACALIVDVLRASTTLTVARRNGATRVVPMESPERALRARSEYDALVCGERDGRKVAGFDLGNSPSEYTPERVRGRTLVFASTNGSLAMLASRSARRRLAAAFVNAAAVVDAVAGEREVAIVCAGKLGGFALEDTACAGLLCLRLEARGATIDGAAARAALAIAPRDASEVAHLVEGASHGRYLRSLGRTFADDVAFCSGLDTIGAAYEI